MRVDFLYQDVDLQLDLTYYEYEPQTRDYEGMPEHYVVEKIFLAGVDITHLVDAEEIERDYNDKMIG